MPRKYGRQCWRPHIRQIWLRWTHGTVCAATLRGSAEAHYAMAAMDKVEGWKEENWVGSYLAASKWIKTKAALCDGRKRNPALDVQTILAFIIESAKVTMKENVILEALQYDIDVPCPLQWSLLWFHHQQISTVSS